jgi:hypothetical protein
LADDVGTPIALGAVLGEGDYHISGLELQLLIAGEGED